MDLREKRGVIAIPQQTDSDVMSIALLQKTLEPYFLKSIRQLLRDLPPDARDLQPIPSLVRQQACRTGDMFQDLLKTAGTDTRYHGQLKFAPLVRSERGSPRFASTRGSHQRLHNRDDSGTWVA